MLAKLCVLYINVNITINNTCKLYNFALDTGNQHKSHIINKFIREHFTSLPESGQLIELSLKDDIVHSLTLYDPGGGGLSKPPPPPQFLCPHAFNFRATLLCVGNFP